ncbi:MAG: hypothetical protein JWO20_1309 [Candidatus Angelobacter sp.]|nr:hypothetical protein [Candidatus Angelobacter sp.]
MVITGGRPLNIRHALDDVTFFIRKRSVVGIRTHHALSLVRRHLLQELKFTTHHSTTIFWDLMHSLMHFFQLLFLFVGEVIELGHPVQHSLLLFRRKAIEALQAIA